MEDFWAKVYHLGRKAAQTPWEMTLEGGVSSHEGRGYLKFLCACACVGATYLGVKSLVGLLA